MSAAKHTPGPWATDDSRPADQYRYVLAAGGAFPYGICRLELVPHREAQEANARLIAAAPELLEALKRIEQRIAYYASLAEGEAPNIEQWAYTDQSGDMAAVRAAIAKAEGK